MTQTTASLDNCLPSIAIDRILGTGPCGVRSYDAFASDTSDTIEEVYKLIPPLLSSYEELQRVLLDGFVR